MTNTLTLLSHAVLSRPPTSASLLTTRFQSELRPALPPKYDGDRQHGKAFVNACQAFFWLRPDQFPDEQIRIQWASMTYMSLGRAQRWVNRIYQWEALPTNTNVNHFVDWDDFRLFFQKEFFPLHAEAVATNVLEESTYFQGSWNVNDYLDEFRDLVSESGYTSPKTIVVKFRWGLNVEIGDAIATMAVGRPDDLDPEAWFDAAVRIDQSRTTNEAFQTAVRPNSSFSTLPSILELQKDCQQYHMSTTNPRKLRKYSTSKECLQMKSGSWYGSCLVLRHQKHRWNLNQRWLQGSCQTDTVNLPWKMFPKHQPMFSCFQRPLAQNHTGNPNGRGSFRKIPKLVLQKLVPIPSTVRGLPLPLPKFPEDPSAPANRLPQCS